MTVYFTTCNKQGAADLTEQLSKFWYYGLFLLVRSKTAAITKNKLLMY